MATAPLSASAEDFGAVMLGAAEVPPVISDAFGLAILSTSEGDTSNGGWADGQCASADDDATYYDATVERWRQWRAECRTPFAAKRSSP